ncbi:hypothetical protein [Frankia sp. R82]|uniref:hypothetical protein n=1 Tax=Frankia sp. R82 TaxID=2950553 RepID=UPI0020442F26|nr:hypothetical protein [Frankia sp. R82]MCM3882138.1 hypothetical protein [Frankia sp. R82]
MIRIQVSDLPRLDLPSLNGIIISGRGQTTDGNRHVCLSFELTGDSSTRHVRSRADQSDQCLVIHPNVVPVQVTAIAFAVGRWLMDAPCTRELPGPIVTSGAVLPAHAGEWRGITRQVTVVDDDSTENTVTVWELMSPRRYRAWLSAECP